MPAMQTKPKVIFFTDFDGTITVKDSNDHLTDNLGYGQARRRELNHAVLEGKMTFRDSFQDMLNSVRTPYDECIRTLCSTMKLDPYFAEFYYWAKENNVPIVILSSGMEPIIHALLVAMLGHEPDNIQIVANGVKVREGKKDINEEGGWDIVFHDDSGFGHDKSIEIRPYADLPEGERPVLLYAGDGVSDLSAASQTDLLFAKKGHDLVTFCQRENIPYTLFEDWSTILSTTKDIYDGKTNPKAVAAAQKELQA
ncbi:hypothetical protein AJ80_00556 [Polytolypa hystricis UAMH7299]|uniref:2,3-diketo-5-methylthio-1-phosphopentane phosphatase n=1 Tax=Polytolypa hystricis (strain UAMH7299) TaxID=1447883 RepID=A0A2B7Z3R2_POLH7|nr:hypothetical protein AJ80_00556 [Polytolypa hystricis UAMH7299]